MLTACFKSRCFMLLLILNILPALNISTIVTISTASAQSPAEANNVEQANQADAARQQALKMAREQAKKKQFDDLLVLAKSNANKTNASTAMKQIDEALELYPDNEHAQKLKKEIASFLVNSDPAYWLQQALENTYQINDNDHRLARLSFMAGQMAEHHQVDQGLALAQKIPDATRKDHAVRMIVTALARQGDSKRAFTLCDSIADPYIRMMAYCGMMINFSETKDTNSAKQAYKYAQKSMATTFKQYSFNTDGQIQVYCALGQYLAEAKMEKDAKYWFKKAESNVRSMEDELQAFAYGQIASHEAEAGLYDDAVDTARQMVRTRRIVSGALASVWHGIAGRKYAKGGPNSEILIMAEARKSIDEGTKRFAGLKSQGGGNEVIGFEVPAQYHCQYLINRGLPEKAREKFEKADFSVRFNNDLYIEIVDLYCKQGRTDEAWAFANKAVENSMDKENLEVVWSIAYAAGAVSSTLYAQGHHQEFQQFTQNLQTPLSRSFAYFDLYKILTTAAAKKG